MNKLLLNILIIALGILGCISFASAQTPATQSAKQPDTSKGTRIFEYTPLITDLPVNVTVGDQGRSFVDYFNFLVKLFIQLTGILAVLMIVWGGIQYVTTDSWFEKDSGKKRIHAAVGGLVLALSSYLILNTIDPSLTYINFTRDLKEVDITDPVELAVLDGSTAFVTIGENENVNDGEVIMAPIGSQPTSETPQQTDQGFVVTPGKVAIDNDGSTRPPFTDTSWQGHTSCTRNGQYLDAGVDRYVVVPLGSSIPCHTRVTITNNDTGQSIQAFVGDRGPGYGEMSRAAAQALGLWEPGMPDAVKRKPDGSNYSITYTFHTTQQ